jgi:hypothetical protein
VSTVLAEGGTRKTGGRAVDLPCSPNAHTRSIVLLERRRSSKRAVGDQSALAESERDKPASDVKIASG